MISIIFKHNSNMSFVYVTFEFKSPSNIESHINVIERQTTRFCETRQQQKNSKFRFSFTPKQNQIHSIIFYIKKKHKVFFYQENSILEKKSINIYIAVMSYIFSFPHIPHRFNKKKTIAFFLVINYSLKKRIFTYVLNRKTINFLLQQKKKFILFFFRVNLMKSNLYPSNPTIFERN